jgi:hypothetical protein
MAKPRSSAGKKRRRKPVAESRVHYSVRVTGWDYYYSLRPGDPKGIFRDGAYSELATLDFLGEIIRPGREKLSRAIITLSAKEGMLDRPVTEAPPSIGHLSCSGEEIIGYIFCPVERLPELVSAADSGRIQFIRLNASKLRYRSASIYSLTLSTTDEEEE